MHKKRKRNVSTERSSDQSRQPTRRCPAGLITPLPPLPTPASAPGNMMCSPRSPGRCRSLGAGERRRAIITVSRVAARRRRLAGCQTRWGPPSDGSRQNKGSVRSADSCNISPGPGSRSFSQNRARETPPPTFSHIHQHFGGCCPLSCDNNCTRMSSFVLPVGGGNKQAAVVCFLIGAFLLIRV